MTLSITGTDTPDASLVRRLAAVPESALAGLMRGVEKESLRVDADGKLSALPHPPGLGSPLTHPRITTDFCEAQVEMVTGVHPSVDGMLGELTQIHQFVHRNIGNEALWAGSMPCWLPADDEIPIGQYGTSNIARSKTIYRVGLANRYGRRMQTISGVHYNFSLPDAFWPALMSLEGAKESLQAYRSRRSFSLIRNFRRYSWLLLYLFGASPAVCTCFVADRPHLLTPMGKSTMHLPYGTSLRMGPLGYQSDAQRSITVTFNGIDEYIEALRNAIHKRYPAYEAIGLRDGDDYRQLSTSLLQIENEFYGTIRPKRRIRPGERALKALAERGVEYVEARCLDLDPFEPIGLSARTSRFMDMFLLWCALVDSPTDTPYSLLLNARNQHDVAERGRMPGLRLARNGSLVTLRDWGTEILDSLEPIAAALDDACPQAPGARASSAFASTLASAREMIAQPDATPSARVLREMAEHHGHSYPAFILSQSLAHREALLALPWTEENARFHALLASESVAAREKLERDDEVPFETYRRHYLAQV
ncbi:MAG: glutamate--cysteine ligase [Lautropia sp.]